MEGGLLIGLLILVFEPAEYYKNFCLNCHGFGEEKGKTYPLVYLPHSLIKKVTKTGFLPFMPPFQLEEDELNELANYIIESSKIQKQNKKNYKPDEINSSITTLSNTNTIQKFSTKDITVFVERGENKIWLIEGGELKLKFNFSNVHGGVKFWSDGFLVPSREGKLAQYSFKDGTLREVNICSAIKNVEVSEGEGKIFVSCALPPSIVILDIQTLKVINIIELPFQPVSVVKIKDEKVVAVLPDRLGTIQKDGKLSLHQVPEDIVSVLVEPFGEFIFLGRPDAITLIGPDFKEVFSIKTTSPPHFFSSAFWYDDGNFYTAIPYLNSIIIIKMYDWQVLKKIDFPDFVFFVRTHPNTNYLWADSGGYIYLINKYTFEVRKIELYGNEFHTEFSADGSLAFITSKGENGKLVILDTATQKEVKKIPAKNPAGKYNLILRSKSLALLGFDVYKSKCWGCHHPTKAAFGPPLSIMNETVIRRQINHPRDKMPKFNISEREIKALGEFIKELKNFSETERN